MNVVDIMAEINQFGLRIELYVINLMLEKN